MHCERPVAGREYFGVLGASRAATAGWGETGWHHWGQLKLRQFREFHGNFQQDRVVRANKQQLLTPERMLRISYEVTYNVVVVAQNQADTRIVRCICTMLDFRSYERPQRCCWRWLQGAKVACGVCWLEQAARPYPCPAPRASHSSQWHVRARARL